MQTIFLPDDKNVFSSLQLQKEFIEQTTLQNITTTLPEQCRTTNEKQRSLPSEQGLQNCLKAHWYCFKQLHKWQSSFAYNDIINQKNICTLQAIWLDVSSRRNFIEGEYSTYKQDELSKLYLLAYFILKDNDEAKLKFALWMRVSCIESISTFGVLKNPYKIPLSIYVQSMIIGFLIGAPIIFLILHYINMCC